MILSGIGVGWVKPKHRLWESLPFNWKPVLFYWAFTPIYTFSILGKKAASLSGDGSAPDDSRRYMDEINMGFDNWSPWQAKSISGENQLKILPNRLDCHGKVPDHFSKLTFQNLLFKTYFLKFTFEIVKLLAKSKLILA